MKSTGIVRKIDELGRIVLPIELRRMMALEEKDALEIYVDGEAIMLKKYKRGCAFCGEMDDLKEISGIAVCKECARKIQETFE